ncbi:MAG TPA: cupredoxin domain-containing protein [Nitrososphaeraceae archaeon]|nr:cupredoxin domain-containing protein [Nitrososphaeraceae archaeon]
MSENLLNLLTSGQMIKILSKSIHALMIGMLVLSVVLSALLSAGAFQALSFAAPSKMNLTSIASTTVANKSIPDRGREVKVIQEPGNTVYWILPGPAKLDEQVFGTPEFPMNTGEYKISKAEGTVKKLFEKFPIMAGVPLAMRETNVNGTKFTQTTIPTPVSNKASIVNGSFEVIYKDRQPYDLPAHPETTIDNASVNVDFSDPAGNQYEIKLKKLYQPPFPGFESGGGVITAAWIHGNTGIDSPLFPTIFTYGALWGVGDIIVNGKTVDEDKWVHFMTTQNVRDRNYNFTTSEGLPLMSNETFSGQLHHTHLIVRPIKITPEGPIFDPVKTEFTLPNGMKQPFIHVMFEQDKILNDTFKDWNPEIPKTEENKTYKTPQNQIVIEAREFSLTPKQITINRGDNVTILFKNVGTVAHSFEIEKLGIRIDPIQPGESETINFMANQAGTFDFRCAVVGHDAAGMRGVLNIV